MKKLLKSVAALSLSAMMLLSPGVLAEEDEEESNVVELTTVVQEYEGKQIVLKTAGLDILEQDGYKFKDLNKNGELDPYEDWRLTPEERTEDLLSRMSDKNKAAQMAHMTLVTLKESWFSDLDIGFALTYTYFAESKESAGEKMNYVQSLCEESELGIPVVFSMDSVIGASWINDTTILPDAITLGATGDAELVQELADIQRQEMKALGVRMSLSPNADLATDPRWGRNQETYGEDADTAKAMVVAAITGLQNGTDGIGVDSVMSCVKHFPGSGPQTGGVDGSPLVFDDETFALHLSIFEAALTVHPASIMPYGYSTVPYLGGDAVENYAHESSVVMNDVLRGRLGYDGIIQTDWGMIWAIQEGRGTMMGEEVSDEEAILIGITESRVDGIGGESIRLIDQMEELTNAGKIDEDILTAAATRIVKAKFELGVFENPYCDVEYAVQFVGNEEHQAVNLEAARKAMTLLKNDGILPLKQNEKQTILVCGPRAGDMDSLVGGWSSAQEGLTIADAVAAYAGENATVIYESDNVERIAELAKDADIIIVSVGEPSYQHDPPWGYDTLEITGSQQEILEAAKASGKPMVTVVTGGRPYILTWCDENTNAILEAYYPGSQGGIAIAETLFGLNNPTGKTPLQFPRDMDSVRNQEGDVSFDLENPLYDYGWGLSYGE